MFINAHFTPYIGTTYLVHFLFSLKKNEVKPDLPEQPVSVAVETPKSSKVTPCFRI